MTGGGATWQVAGDVTGGSDGAGGRWCGRCSENCENSSCARAVLLFDEITL